MRIRTRSTVAAAILVTGAALLVASPTSGAVTRPTSPRTRASRAAGPRRHGSDPPRRDRDTGRSPRLRAFLDADGKALGTLSTLGLAPLPASNNIGDISHELNYAKANSGISGLTLSLGTEPFDPII